MRICVVLLSLLTTLIALPGCGPTASSPKTGGTTTTEKTTPAAAPIALVSANEKDLSALVEKNKGKVVFIDYWALFCKPCVKGFPHTVELHQKHAGEGLVVVSVNFDGLEREADVKKFLEEQNARFDNLISSYDPGTEASEAFGIGPLPHLRLYDRKGELRHKWDGKPEDLEAKIAELLAEK